MGHKKVSTQTVSADKVGLRTKILYAMGNVYGGGGFQLVGFLYSIFLSDTIGLNMAYIPFVMLAGKIWDGITDPLMGRITDKTRSKWGRRRPYFLFGSIAVLISYVLLFAPVSFESQSMLLAYAILSYMTFSTIWTVVMVPYFAFGAEITLDYNERTRVMSVSTCFSLFGSILASSVPTLIINSFPTSKQGYTVMAVVFGAIFGISVLCVFFSKKEVVREDTNTEKVSFFKSFINALKIRSFRAYVGMFIFGMLGMDIISMIMAYYTRYYLRKDGILALCLTTALLTQLVCIPLWTKVANKYSKRTAYMTGGILVSAMGVCLFFLPKTISLPVIIVMIIAISIGLAAVMFIPHTILGDIVDIGEFAYGKRQEGTYSGFATFIRKISSGIGLAIVTGILGVCGYVTPPEGTTNFTEIYQPPMVEFMIRMFMSLIPVCLVLVGVFCATRFKLAGENHGKLIKHLNSLREGKGGTLTKEEEEDLRKQLIGKKAV
ncbi:MAG: glycoside-pentoside-hexuronide (GPH):cation symporter [Clostridiales bacterium]|nr:glycoside-pentoside-hexuronide (GPH):cation symporter [Clostridiales bacterium]MDY3745383.1 glycoside-pentoside-hexuronide (GPH):cation symporter [Lachnospiraceae bacterium]